MTPRGARRTGARRLFATHREPDGRARTVATPRAACNRRSRAPVEVAWSRVRRIATDRDVVRAARAAREHGGRRDLALSIVFVSDRELARLHARHLGDPTRTDVITFDLSDDVDGAAGELYVSSERAARVARARGVSARRELCLYVVHGVLHLCGHDDHARADRAAMRAAERVVMRALGFDDDLLPHDE